MTPSGMGDPGRVRAMLLARGIEKRFGATRALAGVGLELRAGEVHALVGENGAGKSTLMRILAGALAPDAGTLELEGRPFAPKGPRAARAAGVAIVTQELNLAPHLTVEENLTLGLERATLGVLRPSAWRARVERALARLQRADLQPGARVGRLAPGARELVEIARALLVDARVLILDEPTSSLGPADIEHLFEVVRALRDDGVAVVYISHFLEEVRAIAETVTVLRDGQVAHSGALARIGVAELVEAMLGRELDVLFPAVARTAGEPLLHIEELHGRLLPRGASLTLHRGEVLGLAGLVGAGRTELLRVLFGLDAVRAGRVRIGALESTRAGPRLRLSQGVGLASEDRTREGLALERTIEENVTLSRLGPFARLGCLDRAALERATRGWIERLSIRCAGPDQAVRKLSGGNQQKVALARLLQHDVDMLLLDDPTRGVDVGSKAEIYALLGELAARGKAALVASSSAGELLGICDRVAVMHRGRIVATHAARQWTEHALVACATSGKELAA
jgi:ribose transport system ATP-binding protein